MAAPKNKKGRPTAVSKLGPKPGIPPMPHVDINLGIGKIKHQLRDARKEGKNAAAGQLGAIADSVGGKLKGQERKYDRETSRVLRNLARINERSRLFSASRLAGAEATRQSIASGYGASPGAGAAVRRRSRQLAAQGRGITGAAESALGAGQDIRRAGRTAVGRAEGIEKGVVRTSMSMLDVLGAEQKREDIQYLENLRMQERMQELQFSHDLQMQQMQFNQSVYQSKLQNALQKDYLQYQYDNGYLMKPDEQMREQFKYDKKLKMLDLNMAKKETDPDTYNQLDSSLDTATGTMAEAATLMQSKEYKSQDWAATAESNGTTTQKAQADWLWSNMTSVSDDSPYAGVAKSVISEMSKTGTTPTWDSVSQYLSNADPKVATYISDHPNRAARLHEQYRALNAATLGMDTYQSVLSGETMQTDPSLMPPGTTPLDFRPTSAQGGGGENPDTNWAALGLYAGGAGAAVGSAGALARKRLGQLATDPGRIGSALDEPATHMGRFRQGINDVLFGGDDFANASQGPGRGGVEFVSDTAKSVANRVRTLMSRAGEAPTEAAAEVIEGGARTLAQGGAVSPFAREAGETVIDSLSTTGRIVKRGVDTGYGQTVASGLDRAADVAAPIVSEAGEVSARTLLSAAGRGLKTVADVAGPVATAADAADALAHGRIFGMPAGEVAAYYTGDERLAKYAGAESAMDATRGAQMNHEDSWHSTARQFIEFAQHIGQRDVAGMRSPKDYLDFVKANSLDSEEWTEDEAWDLFTLGARLLRGSYTQPATEGKL